MTDRAINKDMQNAIVEYLKIQDKTSESVLDLEPFRVKESLANVIDFLKELMADIDISEMDCNGWQWDVWVPFELYDDKYSLGFCGFYNNDMKIYFEGE